MKIRSEEVMQNYLLLDKLEHEELIPFIKKYLNRRSAISFFYYSLNILLLLLGSIAIYANITYLNANIGNVIFHYCFGSTVSFLLIPIHEYIHVLAYKYVGASETSLDCNLKKFYFMALADKFVANRKEFTLIALAPFVVISSILIILAFFSSNYWQLTILGCALLHSAMCSGDFGLLGYFLFHKDKEVVTFDDVSNKVSYFFTLKKA